MGTNTVNVKCDLKVEDAIAWNNYYLENSKQWKNNWKLIRFVFIPVMAICFIVGTVYLISGIINGHTIGVMLAGGIGTIIGAVGFFYYLYYPNILKRKIKKNAHIAYSRQNSFIGNHKYTVSAEGIRDNDEALVKWTAVEGIDQTATHLFILVHPKKAVIIPKRSFSDDAAFNRFFQDVTAIFHAAIKIA